MTMRRHVALALVTVTLLAGCRKADDAAATRPVTGKEWTVVIADWYDNGRFDQRPRCVAVRRALGHLPSRSPDFQSLHRDFAALEVRVC
jgi:hypothetical protein